MRAQAIAALGLIMATVTPGLAHETPAAAPSGSWRATLVSARDPARGVHVSLLPGRVPGVLLENSGSDVVLILGRSGEPFLRFTDRGVEANVRSPLWRENAIARGQGAVIAADPLSPPEWRQVSRVPRFAWLEFRAWPGTDEPAPGAFHRNGVTPRSAWAIPAQIGERPVALLGLTTWQPARSSSYVATVTVAPAADPPLPAR